MKLTLSRLMYWEWRRLWRGPMNLALIGVWCGLLATAAWQGATMTAARHAEIAEAKTEAERHWQAQRALLLDIEAGRAERGPYGGPDSPTIAVLGMSADQPVVLMPSPLALVAVSSTERAPSVKHAGMLTNVYAPPKRLENPANSLAGRLDVLFVVTALLPLFVLALAFDVLSRERELGIWPLVASQPLRVGRLVAARLGLHFVLLWLPLVIAAVAAGVLASPGGAAVLPVLGELGCWLVLAAAYLLFWQALAAWVNFRGLSAASNALVLCGAWLLFVLIVPVLIQVGVGATTTAPDRLGTVLASRDADIELRLHAEAVREAFYAEHGYEEPTGELNEYDRFYVGNIVPRIIRQGEVVSEAYAEVARRRAEQSRRTGQLAWASPAMAFRRASEQLAGASPVQQAVLFEAARAYQRQWRATYGAKLASMTPLTVADYDARPAPPVLRLGFAERLRAAAPAVAAVLLACGLALGWALPATRRKRGAKA